MKASTVASTADRANVVYAHSYSTLCLLLAYYQLLITNSDEEVLIMSFNPGSAKLNRPQ